jgi:hypothetical protein
MNESISNENSKKVLTLLERLVVATESIDKKLDEIQEEQKRHGKIMPHFWQFANMGS